MATGTWVGLLALGAFHGVNPGMGWLFAVARGLQEGRRAEVWRALLPLGVGHALAVGAAVVVAVVAGRALPLEVLRWTIGALLVVLGARRLVRHRHPRWRGMNVGMGGLMTWSFLMASAHGAGLMVVPFVLGRAGSVSPGSGVAPGAHEQALIAPGVQLTHAAHTVPPLPGAGVATGLLLTAVHAAGYLAVSALIAVVVYEKVGLRFLRSGWLNVDFLWAVALILAGVIVLL